MSARLAQLETIAARVHAGQRDKQGAPYLEHIQRVTAAVSDPAKPVALFHDALEDHPDCVRELVALLSTTELAAVDLLTRRAGEPYADYITRIAAAPGVIGQLAREVKLADLRDNLSRLTPQLERLRLRYTAALATLS